MKNKLIILFILLLINSFLFSNLISPTPLNVSINELNEQMINYIKNNPEVFEKQYEKNQSQKDLLNKMNSQREVIYVTCPVFLVHFPDNNKTVESRFFNNMLNNHSQLKSNYPTTRNVTSAKEYYLEESNQQINISFDIIEWTILNNNYSYYTNNEYGFGEYPQNTWGMFEDLVNKVDPYVDFSKYDFNGDGEQNFLILIHSGPGQEITGDTNDIWSHKTNYRVQTNDGIIANEYSVQPEYVHNPYDGTVGVFVHEFGHLLFGLVDLYDTDYSSYGIGDFGLMGSGSWGTLDNKRDGSQPTPFTQYHKILMGFESFKSVSENNHGPVTLKRGEILKIKHPVLFREYLLVHFPKKTSYSGQLPSNSNNVTGLIIEHIDENKSNNNTEWYPELGDPMSTGRFLVQIKQKDGQYDLEKRINQGELKDGFFNGDYLIHNNNGYGIDFDWYYSIDDSRYYNLTDIVYDSIKDEYTLYFDGEEPEPIDLKPYKILTFKNKFNEYHVLIKTKDNSIPKFDSYSIDEDDMPNHFRMDNNIYFYKLSEYEMNNLIINGKQLIEYSI